MPHKSSTLDGGNVSSIVDAFDRGHITKAEAFDKLKDSVREDNIDALISSVPDVWRNEFVAFLEGCGRHDGEFIRLHGGIGRWERENDPVRRSELLRAEEEHRAAEQAHFQEITLPAIRAWIARSRRSAP